jgi:hypothetical protein
MIGLVARSKHSGSLKIEPSGKLMTEKIESVYEELLRNYPAA